MFDFLTTQVVVRANDLLQNIVSAPGLDQWLGVGVVMCNLVIDGGDQLPHAGQYPTAQPLGGDIAKKALDQVQRLVLELLASIWRRNFSHSMWRWRCWH